MNQASLSIGNLSRILVKVPGLDEQKHIAAILDQVDKVRKKRRKAAAMLDSVSQVIFYDTFGDPSINPRGWPIGTIGDLAASTQYGTSSKAGEQGAFPILRMGNILPSGALDLHEMKYIDLDLKEIEKYTVKDGDILFNRTNSPDLVGKTAVCRGGVVYAYAGYLVRLRVNELAVPEYIGTFLNTPYGKKVLRGMCKAIIGMANINAQELKTISIPMAPLRLQQEFQARLAVINLLKPTYRAHQDYLDNLFSSLRHRAFNGELTAKASERELAEAG